MLQNILVVGGNGFIGSAVCKAALARGMQVTSISSSGRPFKTPKGHSPAWTSKVKWLSADALIPSTYAELLPTSTAVVHTLGTLLEDNGYKTALRNSDVLGMAGSLFRGLTGSRGENPLEEGLEERCSYEALNRDAALRVCKAFASSPRDVSSDEGSRRAFIYVSAEDIFRPFVPLRYIETKRQAELGITGLLTDRTKFRAAYIRPSLVYHSHFRPLTTPIATLLDLSSTLHRAAAPTNLPTPSSILRSISSSTNARSTSGIDLEPSPLASIANAMTVPPIHVDHVAEAICKVIADDDVEGVVDVRRMRELIGWTNKGREGQSVGQHE